MPNSPVHEPPDIQPLHARNQPLVERALALYNQCFSHSQWSLHSLRDMLGAEEYHGWVAVRGEVFLGFILIKSVTDIGEAEIMTLAVAPDARRQGIGKKLLLPALEMLQEQAIGTCFLDVAVDNESAIALYIAHGFKTIGQRRGYYTRPTGAVDALQMKWELGIGFRKECHPVE